MQTDGVRTWAILFTAFYSLNLIIDNYTRYGIIKYPSELFLELCTFIQLKWIIVTVLYVGLAVQIVICYVIEKLLLLEILQESYGILLNLFNCLLVFHLYAILRCVYDINPFLGIVSCCHILIITLKMWSYICYNRNERLHIRRSNEKLQVNRNQESQAEIPVNKEIQNTENGDVTKASEAKKHNGNQCIVKFSDLVTYLLLSGKIFYTKETPLNKPKQYIKCLKAIFYIILIVVTEAILWHQFIFPEAATFINSLNEGNYANVVGSVLKAMLPINVAWLLYFYCYYFKIYLPFFGWLFGHEDVTFAYDWWNSENTTIFWSKWNLQVHIWLKELFFIPTLKKGYSKQTASLVVGIVTGILHEYLISFPFGIGYGIPTLVMLAQIPLAYFTKTFHKNFGGNWGNGLVWLSLILTHTVCVFWTYFLYYQQ